MLCGSDNSRRRKLTEVPSAYQFKDGVPFQIYWDNSCLDLLRTCPRKYYYAIVCGLSARGENVHLKFGFLYHQALEYSDRLKVEGIKGVLLERAVLKYVLTISWGWNSDHKMKNRVVLVRAVMAYLDHFKNDAAKTLILQTGKPAVELSFRFEIELEGAYGQYGLCGHLDKLIEFDGANYVLDRKTTLKSFAEDYIKSFKPSGQMQQYTAGGQVGFVADIEGVIIDACYIATNLDTLSRFKVSYTKDQMSEWLDNTKFYIKMAE